MTPTTPFSRYRLHPTLIGVTLQYRKEDGCYADVPAFQDLWSVEPGSVNDPLDGAQQIRRLLMAYIADEALDGALAYDLRVVADQGYAACCEVLRLREQSLAELQACEDDEDEDEDDEDEDEDTGLQDLVASPAEFTRRMLDLGLEPSEAEEALLDLGFERADDEGSHLCLWDHDADSWVETTLSGLWTHPSWPEGTVIYDESTDQPSWVLATWDDAAEGDEPFGYVHDRYDAGLGRDVQVRVLPYTRNRS